MAQPPAREIDENKSYRATISTNRGSMRRVGLSVGWSWGRPPETKARKQADETPRQDQPALVH